MVDVRNDGHVTDVELLVHVGAKLLGRELQEKGMLLAHRPAELSASPRIQCSLAAHSSSAISQMLPPADERLRPPPPKVAML